MDKKIREIIESTVNQANHGYCETSHDCDIEMEKLIDDAVIEVKNLYSKEVSNE